MSSHTVYTITELLKDCAANPQHSKAGLEMFQSVWNGLTAWMASNWMQSKGVNVAPMGKFVFFIEELNIGNKTMQKAKVPSFIPNDEWHRTYNLRTKAQPPRRDEGMPVEMNYANIAQFAGQSKDMVTLCLKDIFLQLGHVMGQGRKTSIDWYIGRLTAEHGIVSFTFFDSESLQRREAERARGKTSLGTNAPDSKMPKQTSRSVSKMSHRSNYPTQTFGAEPRPDHDVELNLGVAKPPTVSSRAEATQYAIDPVKTANIRDVGNRATYDASQPRSVPRTQRTQRSRHSRPMTGRSDAGSEYSVDAMDYTNTLSLIGAKNRPDPGAPTATTGYGSPTKQKCISDAYARYEADIKRRQDFATRLDQDASDRNRLQSQVEVLKSEQKRREQTEMKRMLAKQVVERQKKREEERREKLVPYDLTHVLPLERDRDFFQEYAEKQGMKRALFKQMEEKKAIKQRELDRERAMDLEAKEALAVSLAKEHALNSYQQQSSGQMLRDHWQKQMQLKEIESSIEGDSYAPEPQGKKKY